MLNRGAVVDTTNHVEGEFMSDFFLVEKKDGGNQLVRQLRHLY